MPGCDSEEMHHTGNWIMLQKGKKMGEENCPATFKATHSIVIYGNIAYLLLGNLVSYGNLDLCKC